MGICASGKDKNGAYLNTGRGLNHFYYISVLIIDVSYNDNVKLGETNSFDGGRTCNGSRTWA